MTLSSRIVFSTSITEGKGKAHAFWTHICHSINNVMMELPVKRGYEPQDLSDVSCRLSKGPGAKELHDELKALYPNLDFRAAALGYTGTPITVTLPIDNGRSTVTRTFHSPFTPVDHEDDYRVAYQVFSARFLD